MTVSFTRARYYLSTYAKLLVVPGHAEKFVNKSQSITARAAIRPVSIANKIFLGSVAWVAIALLTLKGSIPNLLSASDFQLKRACVFYVATACASALFTAVRLYQAITSARPIVREYH